jgi:hypothetical protein
MKIKPANQPAVKNWTIYAVVDSPSLYVDLSDKRSFLFAFAEQVSSFSFRQVIRQQRLSPFKNYIIAQESQFS